jgi:Peptidase family M28/PDZ domain
MTKRFILPAFLLTASLISCGQSVSKGNLKKHIETLASDAYEGRGTGLPGEEKAAVYIESQFKKLKLKPLGDAKTYRQAFAFKGGLHGTGSEGQSKNIVGFLDNSAATTIIIGAHYDHLGLGNEGSSLDANPKGKIHNGADDNASGVAGVLELARYFQSNKIKEKANFVFICFSGEELGLHGSKYFTEHPTLDFAKVNYMINMDMVGRLEASKGLSVSGSGTTAQWEPLLKKLSSDQLTIKTDSSGVGPSDHTSFYLKNIPVLHFFTGSHSDYHKPTDDADKVNYDGEVAVLDVIIKLINANETQNKLTFLTTKNRSMSSSRSFKVTMGVMPSYSATEVGLKVDGVSEGKPAQKAGILTGDVITQIGDIAVKDIQTYMDALGKFEKGQTVPVKLKRGSDEMTVSVTF